MASKRSKSDRPAMIHCEYCGEDYASTYKHCPFCDELPPDDDDADGEEGRRSRGGRRLVTNTRGGGYGRSPSPLRLVGIILSLAVIIAAVIIVVSVIIPLVTKGGSAGDPSALESVQPSGPVTSETPGTEETPDPSETIPDGQTATDFTLNYSEFSLSNRYPDPITLVPAFIPQDSTGFITWTSSDPEVVSVDENGKVSPGGKTGSATITATMAGGVTRTCLVHNSVTSGASAGTGSGTSASTTLSLNRTDFTLSKTYPSFQVQVSGTSSTPVWSIGNAAVATVSANGTVTYVAKGTTTLTCSVDGQTLTCTVRCN